MIKKVLRDNLIVNLFLRNVLKTFCRFIKPLNKLTSFYRVYGTVNLKVGDIQFKIYSASDDHIANEIFYAQNYEMSEFALAKELLKGSRYFVDIGANTGIFSIYASRLNREIKVASYEPHPANFARLLKNVLINKIDNISAFQTALGRREETIQFTIPADRSLSTTSSANGDFTKNFHKIDYEKIDVEQSTMDAVLKHHQLTNLDLIKIDVEYYELEVLKGAVLTLSTKKPLLLIEILQYEHLVGQFPLMAEKISKNHAAEIQEFLFSLGYSLYSITDNGVCTISSVLDKQPNRNFLFIPQKLPRDFYSFSDLGVVLRSLN